MSMRTHNGRTDLRIAAIRRKADAEHLLRNGKEHSGARYARGAAYLAGYAVECKLKAVAMEVYDCWTLDELISKLKTADRYVYTHGLESFAKRLPMWNRLRGNRKVWRDFCLVNKWRPHWRYDPRELPYPEARRFLDAVGRVLVWFESNRC